MTLGVTQECGRCEWELLLHEFHPGKRGKPGSYCRDCCNAYMRGWNRMPPRQPTLSTSYRAVHKRVQNTYGKAAEYPCSAGCGRQADHWAYDHTDPDEITGWAEGRRRALVAYSADPAHYVALCRSCHGSFDAEAAARRAADRVRATSDDLPMWVRPPDGFALIQG